MFILFQEAEITLKEQKSRLRKQAGKVRETAHQQHAEMAKAFLADTGLDFLDIRLHRETVSGFLPYRSEIDVTPLLSTLTKEKCQTCLPVVTGPARPLLFRQWSPGDPTKPGAWDIPVPLETAPTIEPDILLVPLLAFDSKGFRLGYGGGFYDRTIEKLANGKPLVTIGVAYSAQQITNVPTDRHDQRLDWILTEKGPIKCG